MTEQAGTTGGKGGRDAAALALALRERERQLRDLTEQALGFLEELAESRRHSRSRDQLAERIGELERALEDARGRLRHAGSAASLPADAARPELEIVCWGEGARERAAAIAATAAAVPVTWLAVPADAPAEATLPPALVHRDARTPAQCWNLGMAATHGACVLFLGPGASTTDEPPLPPAAASGHAAFGCPHVLRQDGDEVGCEEASGLLDLRPRAPAAAGDGLVPFPSPDAFFLRRAAFEHLGPFDEALLGPASLVDYAFRARKRNLEVLAAAECTVHAALPLPVLDDPERLRLLARHRPEALGQALASVELLWQLEPAEGRALLQRLLADLDPGAGAEVRTALLDTLALGLVGGAMPQERLAARLQEIRTVLLQPLAEADFAPGREEAAAALQGARTGPLPVPEALTALLRDLDLDRRIRAAMLATVAEERSIRRQLDGELHAQLARAERLDGARAAAQQRLEQHEAEYRRLEQEFVTLRDAQAAAEHLLHGCQRRLTETEHALEAANRQRTELERALDAGARREAELDRALTASTRGHDELRRCVAEREQWISLLLREVGRRRLFPRRLLDHERELLRRTGQQP